MNSWTRCVAALVGVACSVGCSAAAPNDEHPISGAQWRRAREEVEKLRQEFAPTPGTMRVTVEFSAASKDLTVRGRGAVARRPPEDLRMILVGPGGVTALDLLVRGHRWRLVMPRRQTLEGDALHGAQHRGLPVGFLRWWLLRPFAGRLLAVRQHPNGRVFVLRVDDATIQVQRRSRGLVMERKSGAGTERLSVSGPGCATALYQHLDARVRAEVRCEGLSGGVADRMFE